MRALTVVLAVLLSMWVQPDPSRAASPPTGQIEVTHEGPRALPPGATALTFTGLAADDATVLFAPVAVEARPRITLKRVPTAVKILSIEYLAGADVVARFAGFVQVEPSRTARLASPPWVTHPACATAVPDELGMFGADLDGLTAIGTPGALPFRALPDRRSAVSGSGAFPVGLPLPSKVTLDNVPPVGMQGTIGSLGFPGSCISWSYGYGLGSYTAARTPEGGIRWSTRDPANQASPAFLYSLVHAQEDRLCPTGSSDGYLPQLVAEGAPSVAQVPYAPDCCYLNGIDVTRQFPKEDRFRIGSYANISLPASPSGGEPSATLAVLEEFLASGMAVAFAGPVFDSIKTLPLDGGVFYPCANCWCPPDTGCGHGMLLVGYDDTIGDTALGLGAFLVQNSFGTSWPPGPSPAPPGQFYLSYQGFLASQLSAAVAYPRDPRRPAGRPLVASAAGAPIAHVTSAYQWVGTFEDPGPSYLILLHWFSEPVELVSVTLAEPSPSTTSARQSNAYPISNGYTYLKRTDGKSWLAGTWTVTIAVKNAAGQSFTYTGALDVGAADQRLPQYPAATMPTAPGAVTGTTGRAATVN
jgi:hypothetical protein